MSCCYCLFFFFKRKTAYEMRISDWSSDVCSSDLGIRGMKLTDCHNIDDFRALAKRRLPWPVFDYIDGAADDEVTRRRNRDAFDSCDLIPRVLAGMEKNGRAPSRERVCQYG